MVPTTVAAAGLPRLDAADVRLAIEIVSPGSGRTDRISKPVDYAEAGIADYWIVELKHVVSVDFFHLDAGQYELTQQVQGGIAATGSPAPVRLDLDALIAR